MEDQVGKLDELLQELKAATEQQTAAAKILQASIERSAAAQHKVLVHVKQQFDEWVFRAETAQEAAEMAKEAAGSAHIKLDKLLEFMSADARAAVNDA